MLRAELARLAVSGCGGLYKQLVAAAVVVASSDLQRVLDCPLSNLRERARCQLGGVHHLNYSPLGTKAASRRKDVEVGEPVVPR